jgi:HD-GYP domain-containing protein (c-di-GMP phosphodiesterase class II)
MDISTHVNSQHEKGRLMGSLTTLREINTAITSSLEMETILDTILASVVSLLGVDASNVFLLDEHTQALRYAGGRGFRTDVILKSIPGIGEGCAGEAFNGRRVIYLKRADRPESRFTRKALLFAEGFVSYIGIPLVARDKVIGIIEIYNRSVFEPRDEWLEFLEVLAGQTAIALNNTLLIEELRDANINLSVAYDRTLEGWSRALELRDDEIEGHAQRVADMSLCLAAYLGLPGEDMRQIRRGALLHDIGKIGIPDRILLKPGPLSPAEWEIMKLHPKYAYDLLSPIEYLKPALDIPYCHHERWDGSGYPRGLSGEQIPLAARIFAVVDVWDALLSDRSYRPAWSEPAALSYIRAQAGVGFDPEVVRAFLKMIAAATPGKIKSRADKIKLQIGTGPLASPPGLSPASDLLSSIHYPSKPSGERKPVRKTPL